MVVDLESGQQEPAVFPRAPRVWQNAYYPFLRKHRSIHNIYQALGWVWMLLYWQAGYRLRRRVRSLFPAARGAAAARFLIIRMNHHGAGFFAYFTFALNQLK